MSSRKQAVAALAVLALLAGPGTLFAAAAVEPTTAEEPASGGSDGGSAGYAPEPTRLVDTVFGWVVDANGWLGSGLRGAGNRRTAVANSDMGTPLVILTDGGAVIYPVDTTVPSSPKLNNERLAPYIEQRVLATGRVIGRGKERAIVVNEVFAAQEPKSVAVPVRESTNTRLVARVTDLSCWLGKGEAGASHAQCAQACAKAGEPLVLVDGAGHLYYPVTMTTPTGPVGNAVLMGYCEQKVEVTGTLIERGKERAIVIDKVAAYAPGTKSGSPSPGK